MPEPTSIAIGTTLAKIFEKEILAKTKEIKNEFLQTYANGYSQYIEKYYEKYSFTKTFIHRDSKVPFHSFFYPVTISFGHRKLKEASEILRELESKRFMTILGNAGSGKSTLMKHMFLHLVENKLHVPILFELRNITSETTITELIYKTLLENKLARSQQIIEQILDQGDYVFLLDGFDEISINQKKLITDQLEEFVDKYNKNMFLVTSRAGAGAERLQRFDNYFVDPLNPKEIEEFVQKQFSDWDDPMAVKKLLLIVNTPGEASFQYYLSNPLLLSMFILTFQNYPEVPKLQTRFYWNVFDTLYTKHDTFTKSNLWQHDKKTGLKREDFEDILKWFCYITLFQGVYSFDAPFLHEKILEVKNKLKIEASIDDILYDLNVSIGILINDGLLYTLPHKSLQEYFAASLISNLTDAQKQNVYKKRFLDSPFLSNSGNTNLFKLCFELDTFWFSKCFLIPKVETFLASFKTSYDINNYFSTAFSLAFIFEQGYNGKYKFYTYQYIPVPRDSYLDLFYDHYLGLEEELIGIVEPELYLNLENGIFYKTIDSQHLLFDIYKNFDEKTNTYIDLTGTGSVFRNILNSIERNLQKLKNDLHEDDISTSELLGDNS